MLDDLVIDFIILTRSIEWVRNRIVKTCSEIDKARKAGDDERLDLLYERLHTDYGRIQVENRNMDKWLKRYQELRLLHAK